MTTTEVALEILKSNPQVTSLLYLDDDKPVINTSVDPETLELPEGFYYNAKNGITNKHSTSSGLYISLTVMT